MITLASREFRVLFTILLTSLRCLRIFGFVGVAWCCVPTFIAFPHGLLSWGPFIGFWASVAFVRATVVLATIAAPILLLALRSAAVVAVFFPVLRFSH